MELQVRGNAAEDFYCFCAERPQGVTLQDLQAAGWGDQTQILNAANVLLGQGRLSMVQLPNGGLLYQAIDPLTAQKFYGLDPQHMLVYQLIERAADKGAWTKSLKDQSNLQQHTVAKVTKELLRRQLIKEVKSVQSGGRKVFMLWDTEPAREVSGGTWYHDGTFAANWIESLRSRCQEYLENNRGRAVSLQDVHMFAMQQPGPSVPQEEDIAAIMRTLELDEEVYSMQSPSGQTVYTQRNAGSGQSFDVMTSRFPTFMRPEVSESSRLVVPCIMCQLRDECQVGGRICPEKCEYFTKWVTEAMDDNDATAPRGAAEAMYDF